MPTYKKADPFPPMWKPDAEGEQIDASVVSINNDGEYGTTYRVKLRVPALLTVKHQGEKTPTPNEEFIVGDIIALANHVNLMGSLEGRVHVGSLVKAMCKGTIPARKAGKNDTTLYEVLIAEPDEPIRF